MKTVIITVAWQWTCLILMTVPVITVVLIVMLKPPPLMTACKPVEYNSSMYRDMCKTPIDDAIILFCIVSERCHTFFQNTTHSISMMEEGACLKLDYHMDCDWVQLEVGYWSSEE
jgi:hypothetical protein